MDPMHEANSPPKPRRGARGWIVCALVGCVTAAAFSAVGHRVLSESHPHEDAYIIFKYAENIAEGHGIVFNSGGPRSEGVTPFLWLLLVAALVRLGVDAAIASLALNALGAGLAGALLARVTWGARDPRSRNAWARAATPAIPPMIVFSGAAVAAYGGFSSMLYSALVVAAFCLFVGNRGPALIFLPVLGLLIGLFRPDGVVIGVGFSVLGLFSARSHGVLARYLVATAASGAAGVGYFAWRLLYFGHLLPLPLYVKGRGLGTHLHGLCDNLAWLTGSQRPLYLIALVACLALPLRRVREADCRRLLLGLSPLLALFLALAMPHQSQNLFWRFQAPIFLTLLFATLQIVVWALDRVDRGAFRLGLLAVAALSIWPSVEAGMHETRKLTRNTRRTYVDTFAAALGRHLRDGDCIALTEAGRIPYWTRARSEDIVGLNNPHTALHVPTQEYLSSIDPDVVMFHHAYLLDTTNLFDPKLPTGPVMPITPELLRAAVRDEYRSLFDEGPQSYREGGLSGTSSVLVGSIALGRYLATQPGYDLFIVDYWGFGRYEHVYGFRKDWPHTEQVLRALQATTAFELYRSYLELKRDSAIAVARIGS